MVCNVPISSKANGDRNQLGAWLDSDLIIGLLLYSSNCHYYFYQSPVILTALVHVDLINVALIMACAITMHQVIMTLRIFE